MPIANRDTEEFLRVIARYVPHDQLGSLLAGLRMTSAARANKSLATTIWRLMDAWAHVLCPSCGELLSADNIHCHTHELHRTRKRP